MDDNIEPAVTDIKIADGLFIKSATFRTKHTMAPQHQHTWDHISIIAAGSVRAWADDELLGDFTAPSSIFIRRQVAHRFLTLTDETTILCIHRLHDTDDIEIFAENNIRERDLEYLQSLED